MTGGTPMVDYPKNRAKRKPLVERECQACGKKFMAKPSNVEVGGAKACSKECSYKVRKTRSDKQSRKAYECKQCGKGFVEDRPRGNMQYCSNKCSATARGLARRSGRSAGRRSLEFRVWSREIVKRDLKCVDCGATEGLQAHHIKGWNEAPELRYELTNGETLCWQCHHTRHPELPLALFEKRSNRKVIPCEHCSKQFVAKKATRKYCSQECAIEATAKRPVNIVQCEICGETIVTRDANRRFCCMACKRVDDSKRMLGPVGERMRSVNPMHIRHREKNTNRHNTVHGD